MTPVNAAKAALCEAGRSDLAGLVEPNRAGWPTIHRRPVSPPDVPVVVRAFWLGHLAGGHIAARLYPSSIRCVECEQEI